MNNGGPGLAGLSGGCHAGSGGSGVRGCEGTGGGGGGGGGGARSGCVGEGIWEKGNAGRDAVCVGGFGLAETDRDLLRKGFVDLCGKGFVALRRKGLFVGGSITGNSSADRSRLCW